MLQTKQETLEIYDNVTGDDGKRKLLAVFRYRPLPCLAVADYLEEYGERLEASGALSTLSLSGAGLYFPEKGESLDLGTLGVLGRTFVKLVTAVDEFDAPDERTQRRAQSKRLREMIVAHCKLFCVETADGTPLDSEDAINAHIPDIGIALGIVWRLAGGSLRPLSILFPSRAGDVREESPTPSPGPSPES